MTVSNEYAAAVDALINHVAQASYGALHEIEVELLERVSVISPHDICAALLGGHVAGAIVFLAHRAKSGVLSDPEERLDILFKVIAETWAQVSGGPAAENGTTQ